MVQETGTRGGRTAPPAGASVCINPITFSPVYGTVFHPIYHTERWLLRSTSRANALTIQNFPTSVQELSSEHTVLTFKLSNQITLQQPVDTTAISRTGTGSAEAPPAVTAVAQPTLSRGRTQGTDSVETTDTTASAPASPVSPAPPMVKPCSDRISTRTRRRTATAAGTAAPAVDYGFGSGGAP